MNIFFLDEDPKQAAEYLCNIHCSTMLKETTQILSSALIRWGLPAPSKGGYHNHPSVVWAGDSLSNYKWLWEHGHAMCGVYERRRKTFKSTKKGPHKSTEVFILFPRNPPIPDKGFTEPAIAIKDYTFEGSFVRQYRNYYVADKQSFAVWPPKDVPYWWSNAYYSKSKGMFMTKSGNVSTLEI